MVNRYELRLSNYIKVGGMTMETYQTYKPQEVTPKMLIDIIDEQDERGYSPESLSVYQPIKLNDKWLLSFGFIIADNEIDYMEFRIESKMFSICNDGGFNMMDRHPFYFEFETERVEIKYVHQLQNLFFALFGEELILPREILLKM